jgi:MauM/NapG family ferredoxin protein
MLLELIEKIASETNPLRPPGAVEEGSFEKHCIRCRKCAQACPYDAIGIVHGERGLKMGTPYIYPREIPCYLCEDFPCIEVCPTQALEPVADKRDVRMGIAVIDQSTCFPYNGILCRACYERCPIYREAVILKSELYPEVVKEHCVGCGICENVCPTEPKSIFVISSHK